MAAGHDERVFAAATSAGAVALWENNPFKLRQTFSAKGEQRAVAISPGERHVAAGGDDGIARFWQIGGPSAAVEANCGGPIRALVFLENKHAAVAAGAGLTLIDLATAKVSPLPLTGQAGEITAMGASPDGKRLVVGTHEGAASILDAATGNELAKLARPEPGSIGSAQFSPDGRYVLLADWHYGGLLFDAATAKLVMQYSVPSATGAAWSPDGKYCSIFNGRSGAALLFTPDSAVPQQQIDSGFWQPTIAILPDSKSVAVATAGGELLLYPFKPLETGFPAELTGGRVELYTVAPGGFGLSQLSGPTGRGAAAAEPGMGLWDLEKHELVVRMQELAAPVMSADHQMIAGSSLGELTLLRDGKEVLKTVIMPRVRISALAFSPDGARIAAAFPGAMSGKELVKPFVRLYNTSNLQEVRAWPIEQELVTAMQFSPDGRTLITRSGRNGHIMGADGKELAPDFRICFWNVQDGSRLQVLPLGTLAIGEHFTPDSTRLLVVTGEGVIISYVVDGLKETGRIRVPGNGNAVASALSADGKWMLITADDGDARLISVDPLKFAGTVALPGPANYERPLFLKDGRPAVWTAGRGRSGGMALHIGGQPR
jgi:WD40 repeat protein